VINVEIKESKKTQSQWKKKKHAIHRDGHQKAKFKIVEEASPAREEEEGGEVGD